MCDIYFVPFHLNYNWYKGFKPQKINEKHITNRQGNDRKLIMKSQQIFIKCAKMLDIQKLKYTTAVQIALVELILDRILKPHLHRLRRRFLSTWFVVYWCMPVNR